ncbi:MAG: lipopolysaccharide biosynthesis protein [Oscillospiraceae bacterium]|nr:lipopolysaccharide biosynthesis protein [Oscillospiraceae bacterium]
MNKYKKLLGNTLVFGVGQVLSKLIGFFLVALYTHFMTETEYSRSDVIYQSINVLLPLVTFQMSDAVIRFGMDKEYDPRKVFTCANAALLLGMTLFMLFTPLVASTKALGEYTFLLFVACYFSCFRQITSQFVRARGYVKLFMADGVVAVVNQLIFNLIFIAALRMGVTGYVLSIILSDAISMVWLYILAGLGRFSDTRFFSFSLLKEMLRFSAPLIPTYILWWITSASDRFFVIEMVGDTENGIYSVAYKLPTLLMLVTTMFYQAWQMSSIEERNSRGIGKFYETVFGAYSSLIFMAAAGIILLVKPLTAVITPQDDPSKHFDLAYLYTPILVVSMVFQCFCQFLSSVYTTKKKSLNSLYTAIVAAAANIILNFALIPRIEVYGAAIATAFSYFACFGVRVFDVRKLIYFKVNFLRLIVNTVLITAMCVIAVKEPPHCIVTQVLLFVFSLAFNFGAIIKTVKRLLSRRSA